MSAVRIGWDQIKEGWIMFNNYPYYAFFESNGRGKSNRLIFAYKRGDLQGEGWDLLEQNLKAAELNTPSTEYTIQFYDELGKGGKLDCNTNYSGSFNLRMRPFEGSISRIGSVAAAAADNNFLNYLQVELRNEKEKVQDLQALNDELQQELDDLQKEPAKEIGGIIGEIGNAGNQFPWIADIMKDFSTIVKHHLMKPQHARPAAAGGIGKVPAADATADPSTRVNNAILILVTWYTKQYGTGTTDEEKQLTGFAKFADDMQCLAAITNDDDVMMLALKKLRSF